MSNYDSTSGHSSLPDTSLRDVRVPGTTAAAAANHALDQMGQAAHGLVDDAAALNARGQQAWRDGLSSLRTSAAQGTAQTRSYVQAQPLKAVLLAAGAGAALVALWGMWGSTRRDR